MSNPKQIVPGGTPWSEAVGYSRVVRVGNVVEVAGTVAVDENGATVGVGDMYRQTQYILEKIEKAMAQVGAKMSDVVRTKCFLPASVDFGKVWKDFGKAHHEKFGTVLPVNSTIQIHSLVNPEFLIEIEVSAIIQ